jgi:hypothetical protein
MTAIRQPVIMSQQITLRVRPGETVRFPNRCVACGRPATERLPLQAKRGQLTRHLDAPLCADCARQLTRRSGREEQLLRTGRLTAAVVGLLVFVTVLLVLSGAWWLRGLLGLLAGGGGAALVWWLFARRAAAEQLPETRAVREAARLIDFTWRDMTLAFADAALAQAVAELNGDTNNGDEQASADDAEPTDDRE